MRKLQIAATAASLALSSAALAQSQKEFTPSSGAWHNGANWFPPGIPTLNDDVLIPYGLVCTVTGSSAQAKSIELEDSALLYVDNGLTLQVRTPVSHTYATIQLDGDANIILGGDEEDDAAVLRLEMTGGSAPRTALIMGQGLLWGFPGEITTDSSVAGFYVDQNITFNYWWATALDVENDGFFDTEGGDMLFSDDGSPIDVGGAGTFLVYGGGEITFDCADFEGGTVEFTGTLQATAGDLYLDSCGAIQKPQLGAATLIADGGAVWCEDGFAMDGGTVTVSDYSDVTAYGDVNIAATDLTVSENGQFSISQANMHIDPGCTVVLEDEGALGMSGYLYAGYSGQSVSIFVGDDAGLYCTRFEMTDTDVLIESGLFHVSGDSGYEDWPSDFDGGSIVLSGGTFKIGWGYQSYNGAELDILGGVLEVLADDDDERDIAFVQASDFLFTAGKIKVAGGEKFKAD